ncbi:MAG: sucrase ferredoxin [Actinomycetota bacterium]
MAAEGAVCSAVSLAADEPLAGTASRFRSWLLIEQPGRWGHDALVDSAFPPDVGARLAEAGTRLGMRVLLVKQRQRPVAVPRRCFVAHTGRDRHRVASFEVDDPAWLMELDLDALVGRRFEGFGEPVPGPLYLVCTHGKHDPCCARLGGPLYRALAGFGDGAVWEATHVGGDRFAGNVVCFPHGLYFGRVGPGDAVGVAEAYARGRIALPFYRGRSAYPPAVQAAEHFVRERHGIVGVEDLAFRAVRRLARGRHVVEFDQVDGPRHRVEVAVGRRDPRILTCKSREPGRPLAFAVRTPQ